MNFPSALTEDAKICVSRRMSLDFKLPTRSKPSIDEGCFEIFARSFLSEKTDEALIVWWRKKVATDGAQEQITPVFISMML